MMNVKKMIKDRLFQIFKESPPGEIEYQIYLSFPNSGDTFGIFTIEKDCVTEYIFKYNAARKPMHYCELFRVRGFDYRRRNKLINDLIRDAFTMNKYFRNSMRKFDVDVRKIPKEERTSFSWAIMNRR